MRISDAAWLSGTNLMKNPMRTLLTILGFSVGIAAVLTVITLGSAGQVQVEREIAKLGVDKVWVSAKADSGMALSLHSAQTVEAATGAPACAAGYAMSAVVLADKVQAASVAGYDSGAEVVLQPVVVAGRCFTDGEYQTGAPVALVDETLAQTLGDVLGRRISLGSRLVTVVGVTAPAAVQASSGMVILPLRTLMDTFADVRVSELTLSVPGGAQADDVAAMALHALGEGFTATTLQEEIDAARSVIRIFVLVLASVAAVCMVTGGIGVMNILLVSVRERRREIGLIKAVGGTSGQVAALFLLEAACYALLGGAAGLILGMMLIRFFGGVVGVSAALSAQTAVGVLAGAGALGVLFGVIPALKAAGMLPVDALKQE